MVSFAHARPVRGFAPLHPTYFLLLDQKKVCKEKSPAGCPQVHNPDIYRQDYPPKAQLLRQRNSPFAWNRIYKLPCEWRNYLETELQPVLPKSQTSFAFNRNFHLGVSRPADRDRVYSCVLKSRVSVVQVSAENSGRFHLCFMPAL